MDMAIGSLIDKKKKAAFREAMAKGDPGLVFPKKHHDTLVDPPKDIPERKEQDKPPIAKEQLLEHLNYQLIEGAKKGDLWGVVDALNKGADINHVNDFNWANCVMGGVLHQGTALVWAAETDRKDIVVLLIARGADINKTGDSHERVTALMRAATHGFTDIVAILIQNGADPNIRNEFKGTALMDACANGHMEIVKLLVNAGADVNAKDLRGMTPLGCAARYPDVVKLLKKYGAKE